MFVYKILDEAEFKSLPAYEYNGSGLDLKDGFMHLSTHELVPGTANRFFGTHDSLYLLKIPLSSIEENVKFEAAGDGLAYPHLYGTLRLETAEVLEYHKINDKFQAIS